MTWRIQGIRLPFNHSKDELKRALAKKLSLSPENILNYEVRRRSVDARKKNAIYFNYTIDVDLPDRISLTQSPEISPIKDAAYTPVATFEKLPQNTLRPIVVGAGPCGLFAALLLAQMGLRPLLLERGKPARERMRDVYEFWRTGTLNPQSNALFGEGGAGTFSDGKLTTQIKDRQHRCRKVLEEFVHAGAPEEILYLQKPHIGTDNLIRIVENLRNIILELGGEVRFECTVTALHTENNALSGVELDSGETLTARHLILAIGHSARDTFAMLDKTGVALSAKPFSIGVRIEHPQNLIDQAQYGPFAGNSRLGAAEYKLVHHCKNQRSVYTFCMCPGGQVIAASSEPNQIVTNGMSRYHRNAPNANAALLVGVGPDDFPRDTPLAGIAFQRQWEEAAFQLGGGNYHAPAQCVGDFLAARASTNFGDVHPSYTPGVTPTDLQGCLPPYVIEALREALPVFDRKLHGFALPDAVLTGVETRSSSPIRILRNETGQSESLSGLYPAGEGAGYAGGITSAAVDGIRAAEAVAQAYTANA